MLTLCLQVTLYTAGFATISHSKYTSSPRWMAVLSRLCQYWMVAMGVTRDSW